MTPLFPGLGPALDSLKAREPREFPLPGEPELDPLRAILALRNAVAHGGLPDEAAAARHLEAYLPVLHQVLDAFDFLGDCRLLVLDPSGPDPKESRRGLVRMLRGVQPEPAEVIDLDEDLADAFADSPAVLVGPDGRAGPLFPLLNPQPEDRPKDERETIYLYDGHYGARIETKGAAVEKGYIHYLGVHHRVMDTPACARMQELLARRKVEFYLPKEKVAPWTIAETAADYSRNLTLAEMLGRKYLPQCYVPFPELERHFAAFLAAKPPRVGLVLTGPAGSGKSAFLAHQVERLMAPPAGVKDPQDYDVRAHPNLVFFLRGSGILQPEGGISLERDVAEKLGVSARPGHGIATFGELLQHLNERWKQDRVKDRRLILVLDGLNEAPEPRVVLRQALAMIRLAARFPWCKIVVSTRSEWLDVWSAKVTAQEASDLELTRPNLYVPEAAPIRPDRPPDPVVSFEPFAPEQAAEVYARYQAAVRAEADGRTPACTTPWAELPEATRAVLLNPLYLHLFMETFAGRGAEPVATVPALFRRYVDQALREHPGLTGSIDEVIGHFRSDLTRPSADLTDDDVNAIRRAWAKRKDLTEAQQQFRLHPVEDLANEGWVGKRVREEGGGYRFVFQAVAEYLVYLDLLQNRPSGEDELSYWTRRAAPDRVFPEYAGAFGFLLRDWAAEEKLGLAARVVETAPSWFGDVLEEFLKAQARIGHTPGQASPHAQAAARDLAASGGQATADALFQAGYDIALTHLAPEAIVYFQASLEIFEALWKANPENIDIGDGLGMALNNLGNLLRTAGQVAEAEQAHRRAVEIFEALWKANPENIDIGDGLGMALNNLGRLLSDAGQVAEAERAYRRAVEIYEALRKANPENVDIGDGLGRALNNLGRLLSDAGQVAEAERAYRRAVEIREVLWKANPENVGIGDGLGGVLNNLGNLLAPPDRWRRPSGPTAAPSRSTRRCGRPIPRISTSATAWARR